MFDGAAFDDDIDVDGAKQMQITSSLTGTYKTRTNLVNNDVVQIKVGDTLCSVSCFPYETTTRGIRDRWGYGQYRSTYDSKIILRTNAGTNPTLLTEGALWIHTNSTPIGNRAYKMQAFFADHHHSTQKIFSVWSPQGANSQLGLNVGAGFSDLHTEKETGAIYSTFGGDATEWWSDMVTNLTILHQTMGVQVIEFDPAPSANIYSETNIHGAITEFPTDVNFTGHMERQIEAEADSKNYRTFIWGCPSGVQLTPNAQAEWYGYGQDVAPYLVNENVGYPSAVGSKYVSQIEHDDRLYPYWVNNFLAGAAVFRFDLGGDEGQMNSRNYLSYLTHPKIYQGMVHPTFASGWVGDDYMGIKPFESSFHSTENIDHTEMWGEEDLVASWKPINSNELALYYTAYPYINSSVSPYNQWGYYDWDENDIPSTQDGYLGNQKWRACVANWRDINYRRMWAESDVFNKEFFVNARGRIGKEEPHVAKVSGYFIQWNEGITWTEPSDAAENINLHGHKNAHIDTFYKLLTDRKQQ